MELKDWKVYLIVGAMGLAGMLYTCNKRVDVQSSVQLSDVRSKDILFTEQAHSVYRAGLERAGPVSRQQLFALVRNADANKDGVIDESEVQELYFMLVGNAPRDNNLVKESFEKPTLWQKYFERCPVLPDGGKPMSLSEYWRAQQKVYSWYDQ